MSRQTAVDPLPHLLAAAASLGRPGQPDSFFRALDEATGRVIGHKLFTVLVHHGAAGESERRYSSQPAAYPVGGRKPLPPSDWARQVFQEHRAFIGRTAADIERVFADHALIASLGCASVLNLPVRYDGRILGTINLLHEEAWYGEADVPIGLAFAALAVPAMLAR
jgi:GAF domain-containing protein